MKNCWEFKKCGRQPQGSHVHDLGICPAAMEESLDGTHDGTNAGRACWVVAGTLCGGAIQGTFGVKYSSCEQCDFYQQVRTEQKGKFEMSVVLLNRMRSAKKPLLTAAGDGDFPGRPAPYKSAGISAPKITVRESLRGRAPEHPADR